MQRDSIENNFAYKFRFLADKPSFHCLSNIYSYLGSYNQAMLAKDFTLNYLYHSSTVLCWYICITVKTNIQQNIWLF